jgi:hypothetical protein
MGVLRAGREKQEMLVTTLAIARLLAKDDGQPRRRAFILRGRPRNCSLS